MTDSHLATAKNIPPGITDENIVFIKCDDIFPDPYKKTVSYSDAELSSAARMFLKHGVGIPLIVSEILVSNRKKYRLVCGEKIFRSALISKLDRLPCKILPAITSDTENQTDIVPDIPELSGAPPPKTSRIIIKDSRLFFNSVNHAVKLMNESGIRVSCNQEEMPKETVLKITVPKSPY